MKRRKILITILLSIFFSLGDARAEDAIGWNDCVKEAIAHHPDLVSAKEKLNQSKAAKEITRAAAMPQIALDASETTSKGSTISSAGDTGAATVSGGGRKTTNFMYEATGQQLLFDGFKTSYDISSAERNIRASIYNYDVTSSNIRLNLRTAYANLLSAQDLLKVTEAIEARRKQNVDLVKLRYEGGREHKGSLLTSEADLAQASLEVTQAKRSIYYAQRQLVKEMGRSKFVPFVAKGDFEVKETWRERPDFEILCESTPLLKQLVAKKEAAKLGWKSANADFFPQIFGNGSMGRTGRDWPPAGKEWSIGMTASFDVFDGGQKFANLSNAKASLGQTQADERSGRDGVVLTMANTWTKLQNAIDNVDVQRKFLTAAEERARISEAEYALGLLSFDNWTIIEDNLVSAKKNFLTAENNALITEAAWIQAIGGTLDYDKE